jgi:YidC/Oxa1 family membrane protein insertase
VNIFDVLIVQPIFNVLILLYAFIPGGDFGVSIIVFTILFRLAMWPLVRRQLHHTKIMRQLAPELEKIKQRTKGNKQQYSIQMMELYKERGVNPFRPIGIILLQLPIFLALYYVIQIFTSHRDQIEKFTYNFLEQLEPIKQLIEHPNQFNEKLLGFISLTNHAVSNHGVDVALVLLSIAAAASQYIMSKQTTPEQKNTKRLRDIMAEASSGKQADQSEINGLVMAKMIKILPFFMFFIMINLPGALVLYYTVLNIVGAAQQHIILKQDEEEMEEIVEEEEQPQNHKKATAKARAKEAQTATVTRIVAKDTAKRKSGKGGKK